MSSSVQTNGHAPETKDPKGDSTANEALKLFLEDRGIVTNLLSLRRDWMRTLNDPRRDINKECGYPETSSLDRIKYKDMYDRNPIAARAVEVLPKECWQVEPSVYERENVKTRTAFEDSWNNLPKTLRGHSFANTEECGNPVWGYLRRLDILSGIGQFAVMLIGTNDGKSLKEPHEGVDIEPETVTFNLAGQDKIKTQKGAKRKLTYLRVFDESLVTVATWDNEPTSVRYQQPNSYNITMNDTKLNAGIGVSASEKPSSETVEVHWTRVIHVADNLTTSEIFGNSRLMKIYNRCLDLEKVTGGSGEMFWKQAGGLYSLETHPQNVDASFNKTDVKDQFEKLFNSLDRFVGIEGATVKSIAPTVSDPTNQVNVAIEAICIEKGCPVRIFKGSERGELASSQDDGAWNDRLRERQSGHITPHIVIPFIDRLIQMGVLEAPGDKGYKVYWPDLESINEKDKAAIAVQKTQALTTYIGGGGDGLVEPLDYLTKFLGMEDDVAQGIVDNKMKTIEEEDTGDSPLLGMVGGLTGFTDILAKATSGELTPQQAMKTLMVFFGMSEAQAEDAVAEDSIDEADAVAQEQQLAQLDAETQITTPPPVPGQPAPGQKGFPPQKGQFPPTGNVDSDIYDEDWEPTTDELVSVNTEDSKGPNPFDDLFEPIENMFCPTGQGGGVDPSCSKGGGGVAHSYAEVKAKPELLAYPVNAKVHVSELVDEWISSNGKANLGHHMTQLATHTTPGGVLAQYHPGTVLVYSGGSHADKSAKTRSWSKDAAHASFFARPDLAIAKLKKTDPALDLEKISSKAEPEILSSIAVTKTVKPMQMDHRSGRMKWVGKAPTANMDCGTGAGGFKAGNKCAKGGGQSEESITDGLAKLYKQSKDPLDGGECATVVFTMQQLNPKFKAYAITSTSGVIDHMVASPDGGKTFYDGKGKAMTKSTLMKGRTGTDLVEAHYTESKASRLGGYFEAKGTTEKFETGKQSRLYSDLVKAITGSAPVGNMMNCGIGKGGFQRGNQCAAGGGGGKAKFVGQRVGAAEHKAADQVSNSLAKSLGGKVEEQTGGPGQRDKKPYDVRVKRKGGEGFHDIEVKSMLKGSKTSISVHDDALLRKVEHQKQNPSNLFHTVVVDKRKSYDGGAYADNYSGHEIYYKRGSGAYALSKMHKVKNPAELKKLLDMDMKDLPKEARGKLPPPPPPAKLRASADKASEARKTRDQARKLRMRDVLREQARARRMAQKAGDTNA